MCSTSGADADALGHEPGDDLGRERPAGARHLGAARLGGVDVLVGAQRPRSLDVAVADRPAVDGQPGQRPLGQAEPGDPQAAGVAVRRRRASSDAPAAERERRRRRRTGPALGGASGRPAQLDDPAVGVQLGREVHDERGAVGGDGVERGRDRARGVDDDEVAGLEERRAAARTCCARWRRWPGGRPSCARRRGSGPAPRAARAASSSGGRSKASRRSGRRRALDGAAAVMRCASSRAPAR